MGTSFVSKFAIGETVYNPKGEKGTVRKILIEKNPTGKDEQYTYIVDFLQSQNKNIIGTKRARYKSAELIALSDYKFIYYSPVEEITFKADNDRLRYEKGTLVGLLEDTEKENKELKSNLRAAGVRELTLELEIKELKKRTKYSACNICIEEAENSKAEVEQLRKDIMNSKLIQSATQAALELAHDQISELKALLNDSSPDKITALERELRDKENWISVLRGNLSTVKENTKKEIEKLEEALRRSSDAAAMKAGRDRNDILALNKQITELKEKSVTIESHKEKMDSLYDERNRCVGLACSLAVKLGYPVHYAYDKMNYGDKDQWIIVYITLPQYGQVSWHVKAGELSHFPATGRFMIQAHASFYDGHTTEEKYQRIVDFVNKYSPVFPAFEGEAKKQDSVKPVQVSTITDNSLNIAITDFYIAGKVLQANGGDIRLRDLVNEKLCCSINLEDIRSKGISVRRVEKTGQILSLWLGNIIEEPAREKLSTHWSQIIVPE